MWRKHTRRAKDLERVRIRRVPGIVCVDAKALFTASGEAALGALIERVFRVDVVQTVVVDRVVASLAIHYDRSALDPGQALAALAQAIREASPPAAGPQSETFRSQLPGGVTRVERRSANLTCRAGGIPPLPPVVVVEIFGWMADVAAAGVSFTMSVIGLLTPFVPTLPFVLATGFFLARSSPTLLRWFKRSPLFGRLASDMDAHGGLRPSTKWRLILITLALWSVTLAVSGVSPTTLIGLVVVGGISIGTVLRVATIPEDTPDARWADQAAGVPGGRSVPALG